MRLLRPLAALNGLLAVGVGAFGAHAMTDPQARAWVATGASYGLGHAAAAVAVAGRSRAVAWGMTAGALLFSGSLYLMAVTGWHWLGALTPVGGLLMLGGWAWLLRLTARSG